jgi:hypothetical protein
MPTVRIERITDEAAGTGRQHQLTTTEPYTASRHHAWAVAMGLAIGHHLSNQDELIRMRSVVHGT